MKPLYIIGAGGFGREVAWLVETINREKAVWDIKGFIDDDNARHGQKINGYPVLGGTEYLENTDGAYAVCAIGNPNLRSKMIERLSAYPIRYATLIASGIKLSETNAIGEGSIVCEGSILTVNIILGKHSIVNLDCTIGHDVRLGDYVTLYPSVNISGQCNIGERTEVGTGAHIIQSINIGHDSIIGAGSVVIRDIEEYCTAVGNPARVIKQGLGNVKYRGGVNPDERFLPRYEEVA